MKMAGELWGVSTKKSIASCGSGGHMINSCPFCQNNGVYVYKEEQKTRSGDMGSIYKCRRCSALYPHPRLSAAESSEYLLGFPTNQHNYEFNDPRRGVAHRDPVIKMLKKYTKCCGKALDIGTFDGRFCFVLGSLGFKAYGIEPQEKAVDFAKRNGLEVFLGSFPDTVPQELFQKKYDLISAMESIYYFNDIEKALRMTNSLLSDDGSLLIKCHQGLSRYYCGNSYFSRYGDSVQCIPTLASLNYYLKSCGFKIIRIFGETSLELLPLGLGRVKNRFLGKAIYKIYNSVMLRSTLLDIARSDRLMILAKKA